MVGLSGSVWICECVYIDVRRGYCYYALASDGRCLQHSDRVPAITQPACCCTGGAAWGPKCDKCPPVGTGKQHCSLCSVLYSPLLRFMVLVMYGLVISFVSQLQCYSFGYLCLLVHGGWVDMWTWINVVCFSATQSGVSDGTWLRTWRPRCVHFCFTISLLTTSGGFRT